MLLPFVGGRAGLGGDDLADGRDDLLGPACNGDLGRSGADWEIDKAGCVVLQDGRGELFHPLADRTALPPAVPVPWAGQRCGRDDAGQVVDRRDLAGVSPHSRRGLIDDGARRAVTLAEPVCGAAGEPAVGQPAGDSKGLRAHRTRPHRHRRNRCGFELRDLVELAGEGHRRPGTGQRPDQPDSFLEGAHCGPRAQPFHTQSADVVPRTAGAEAEHDPAVAESGQRRDGAGQHRGGSGGEVRDVDGARDVRGPPQGQAQDRVGIEPVADIGVIGDGEEVESVAVCLINEAQCLLRGGRGGARTESEECLLSFLHRICLSRLRRKAFYLVRSTNVL